MKRFTRFFYLVFILLFCFALSFNFISTIDNKKLTLNAGRAHKRLTLSEIRNNIKMRDIITAIHEAGHTFIIYLSPHKYYRTYPIKKAQKLLTNSETKINDAKNPKSGAILGVTKFNHWKDADSPANSLYGKGFLWGRVLTAVAGDVALSLMFNQKHFITKFENIAINKIINSCTKPAKNDLTSAVYNAAKLIRHLNNGKCKNGSSKQKIGFQTGLNTMLKAAVVKVKAILQKSKKIILLLAEALLITRKIDLDDIREIINNERLMSGIIIEKKPKHLDFSLFKKTVLSVDEPKLIDFDQNILKEYRDLDVLTSQETKRNGKNFYTQFVYQKQNDKPFPDKINIIPIVEEDPPVKAVKKPVVDSSVSKTDTFGSNLYLVLSIVFLFPIVFYIIFKEVLKNRDSKK